MDALFDGGVTANDVSVTVRFIRVDNGLDMSELMDMIFQGFAGCVWYNSQTHLATLAPNRSDNWRTIIGICPASTLVIGATARWI